MNFMKRCLSQLRNRAVGVVPQVSANVAHDLIVDTILLLLRIRGFTVFQVTPSALGSGGPEESPRKNLPRGLA
jgi:hypothetical protein